MEARQRLAITALVLQTDELVIKLLELGIAKRGPSPETPQVTPGADEQRPGRFIGTPLYMQPEQTKRLRRRTRLTYSLGSECFYEMVVGSRPPFSADGKVTEGWTAIDG